MFLEHAPPTHILLLLVLQLLLVLLLLLLLLVLLLLVRRPAEPKVLCRLVIWVSGRSFVLCAVVPPAGPPPLMVNTNRQDLPAHMSAQSG